MKFLIRNFFVCWQILCSPFYLHPEEGLNNFQVCWMMVFLCKYLMIDKRKLPLKSVVDVVKAINHLHSKPDFFFNRSFTWKLILIFSELRLSTILHFLAKTPFRWTFAGAKWFIKLSDRNLHLMCATLPCSGDDGNTQKTEIMPKPQRKI
jgi:hypothetical protein